MKLVPDELLGDYRLISRLGTGGMGEVWRAEDLRLGRSVAIKIVNPSSAISDEARARLTREARTAAKLYHPNIATIHAIEQHEDLSFIVMELVDGVPLTRRMGRGPLPESEVLSIARQIAAALAEAHRHGIIHRDIKPDNVVLIGERLKILDFGIAKQIGPMSNWPKNFGDFATPAGVVVGTALYMSPEQALAKDLDPRTDLFSLGVVMYQALAGELPFGRTMAEATTRIIRDEPASLRSLAPSISTELEEIVQRCLRKNRDERFANAQELIAAIDRVPGTVRSLPEAVIEKGFTPIQAFTAEMPRAETGSGRFSRRGVIAVGASVLVLATLFVAGRCSGFFDSPETTTASATLPGGVSSSPEFTASNLAPEIPAPAVQSAPAEGARKLNTTDDDRYAPGEGSPRSNDG